MKTNVEKKDLPTTYTEEDRKQAATLQVAMMLALQFEGRDWKRFPNANQQKFQSLMLRRARDIVKIVLGEDGESEKKE